MEDQLVIREGSLAEEDKTYFYHNQDSPCYATSIGARSALVHPLQPS
jgi:hypothetical protein